MSHGRKKGSRRNLMSHKGQRQQGRQVVANSSKCGCRAETSGAVRVETIRDGKRVDGGKNEKGTREKQIAKKKNKLRGRVTYQYAFTCRPRFQQLLFSLKLWPQLPGSRRVRNINCPAPPLQAIAKATARRPSSYNATSATSTSTAIVAVAVVAAAAT